MEWEIIIECRDGSREKEVEREGNLEEWVPGEI